jgi:hypothetical protein
MSWAERDGPPVSAPKRRGFGEKAAKQKAEDVKLLEQLLTARNRSYPNFPNWPPNFGILSEKPESYQEAMTLKRV